ncbi:MAG: Glycerate 2-kinase [Verrucomicrobiales bacterium]|nr:Glycerate 2-kinase [Verrucomicrobiales bacterium]
MRVLIVPDKFKGTLTAAEAADAIARGWREARPQDHLDLLPMSDGGDGFGPVMSDLEGASARSVETSDAAGRPRTATWWLQEQNRTAVIETVQSIGLALLPVGKFHPFELDTFGLGALFQAASLSGAKTCYAGIGGSATNDGGFGMARALGWQFLDPHGVEILHWTELTRLQSINPAAGKLFNELIIAVDVQNPFLGPTGASRIYGPQKGLKLEDMAKAEAALGQLADTIYQQFGIDYANEPGTGAAGGLGFGLRAFLEGRFEPGFDLFARLARLEERLRHVDLVVTAEGAIDASTLMGKGVGEIARLCAEKKITCIGLAGNLIASSGTPNRNFTRTFGIHPNLTTIQEAKSNPKYWLAKLANHSASEIVDLPSP